MSVAAILRVALIAHDAQKTDMLEWARWNRDLLSLAMLCATKHTGEMVGDRRAIADQARRAPPLLRATAVAS